ncbi:MAG: DUF4384 domain-containing protein [Polyangiaceae bacterium]|nr:DUF4384 domain-containing protein [Polyangiaceae bacterium]
MTRGAVSLWAAGLALALAGCGPYLVGASRYRMTTYPAPPAPSAPGELGLEAFVVEQNGQAERVSLDAPLYTGERVSFVVSASECLYVYVVNLGPDGSARVIWPQAPTCIGATPARIPQGSWFELLAPAGHEVIALVATRDEVSLDAAGERELAGLVAAESARRDLAAVQGERPPGFLHGHASVGFRAEGLQLDGTKVRVPTRDGTAVLMVDVDHRPPP